MSKIALSGNASGTGTLTVASPNTNTDYTLTLPAETGTIVTTATTSGISASALTTGTIPKARMYAGAVLQVVQTQLTTVQTFAPGAGVWTDVTGASASITPSSASNKILITYSTFMANTNNSPYWMQFLRMLRNGTAIAIGTQASYKAAGAANYSYNNQYGGPLVQTLLDSPATTSAITYQLSATGEAAFSVGGSYTSGTNNPSVPTTIILMEIAG